MGLINVRDIVQFPSNGDNSTDTIVNGIHFNTTALRYWNYTLYSNKTLSNGSSCYLIFDDYQPLLLSNGTFINGTDCSVPINPLETRGRLGAIFGAAFGVSLLFTLINLKKHGQSYLREEKRFKIVGRRWPWYWMIFTGACGMISCITGIDVDRDYLQGTAIILQSAFFFAMGQSTMAAIWENIRHWGSWQERQVVDRDPFSLRQDDTRGKTEFYMPLAFYFFGFMNFFLIVPRSWTRIPDQGGIVQQMSSAMPSATDGRFKAGGIFLCVAWLVCVYCVYHNLYYYRSNYPKITALLTQFPLRYTFALIIAAVYVGYSTALAWLFDISVMKYDVPEYWPFALGYAPCLLVVYLFNYYGFVEQNEDKQIIQQRIERGHVADASLGLTKKPNWWSKARGDTHLDDLTRLRGMVAEENIHNNRGTTDSVELKSFSTHRSGISERDSSNYDYRSSSRNRLSPPKASGTLNKAPSNNSLASSMTLDGGAQNPQRIRSMLDI